MVHMRTVNSVATPDRGNGMGLQLVSRAAVDGKRPVSKASQTSEFFAKARRLTFAAVAFFLTAFAASTSAVGSRCASQPTFRCSSIPFASVSLNCGSVAKFVAPNSASPGPIARIRYDFASVSATPNPAITGSSSFTRARTDKFVNRAAGASATFEPGARTAWHTHPLGQTLIVTAGFGRVQRWGGRVEEIRPGDVVWFEPGEKHWHGASPTTAMTHIAIQEKLDGKAVEWMEHVSDDQYKAGGPA